MGENKQEIKTAVPVWEAHEWCDCPYCKAHFDILEVNREKGVYPHEVGGFCIKTEFKNRDPEEGGPFEIIECPKCEGKIKIEETEYFYGERNDL